MAKSDHRLVQLAQRGNQKAFAELVERTARLVYAQMYLKTGDRHLSEDLVQETMLRAFRSLPTLRDTLKYRSWLLNIAHNTLISESRKSSRQKRQGEQHSDPDILKMIPNKGPSPLEQMQTAEARQELLQAMQTLPEEYQLPLTLRYLAGANHDAIQTQLGITNGTLRGLLYRGMQMLRKKLTNETNEASEHR